MKTTIAALLLISAVNATADHQPQENDLLRSRISGDLIAGNTQASPKNDQNHEVAVNNATAAATSEYISYCHDPEANREWEEMMKKHGHSPNWQHIYAERKRLCRAVDDGRMTIETAIEQFERERAIAVEKEKRGLW